MSYHIRSAAVLGAGTMGAQIAAHLANNGIPCLLLDMVPQDAVDNAADRNRLAVNALQNLSKMKPAPLYSKEAAALITPGNFEDDLDKIKDVDWVVEAVIENLAIKRDLWSKVAPLLREGAVASTNTSGIPIKDIADGMPEHFRRRFLGTHFFNPPRYLHLLEVIPLEDTDPDVLGRMGAFAERVLGKGVVVAKDTPNFIANRVGTFGLLETLRAMEEHGLRADEVDAVTGPMMGRPRSATFRTLDVVGIDVFALVADNLHKTAPEQWERDAFALPSVIKELIDRGWLGEKTRKGFYERIRVDGKSEILVLDPETMEFVPRRRLNAPSMTTLRGIDDVGERIKQLVAAQDAAGRFAWTILKRTLLYTAKVAGEMADHIVSIDRAMRWGFGWELGPFEVWDAIGVKSSVRRMQEEGEDVPDWITALAEGDHPMFYPVIGDEAFYADLDGTGRTPLPTRPRTMDVARLRRENKVIRSASGATLYDIGDEVALVDFHSPKQAIGADFIQMLHHALGVVGKDFRGLVVSSHVQPNFSVGANLALILMAAQDQEWEDVDMMVRQFQGISMQMKYFERPVVFAPYGLTLGGGVEMSFGADRIVAAAETYMGLVEAGVGLIPGGGGCKEMVIRSIEGTGVFDGAAPGGGLGSPADLQPFVNKAFETVATAKVATSAREAKELQYMRPTDVIVPNLHHLWYEAKQAILALDGAGYTPPKPVQVPVLGPDGRAVLEMGAQQLHWAGYASEHDLLIAQKLATVLTGGDAPAGTQVSEQYLLDVEREQFLSLVGHPKTLARIQHMLTTGKPLRN